MYFYFIVSFVYAFGVLALQSNLGVQQVSDSSVLLKVVGVIADHPTLELVV